MKKTQIRKHCYVASLTGMLIVASVQLTTASICHKAVIYVNCVDHTESQSIRVTIFDIRKCFRSESSRVKCVILISDIKLTDGVSYMYYCFQGFSWSANHCFPDRHIELHFNWSITIFTLPSVDTYFDYLQLPYTRYILFVFKVYLLRFSFHIIYLQHIYFVL